MWSYTENELMHYGVAGMKWGISRAKRKGTTYTYKSHGTKKYERKARRLKGVEAKQYGKLAKASAAHDRRFQDRVEKMSTGKAAAEVLLLGGVSAKTYNSLRTSDVSQGAAIVAALLSGPGIGRIATGVIKRGSVEKEAFGR